MSQWHPSIESWRAKNSQQNHQNTSLNDDNLSSLHNDNDHKYDAEHNGEADEVQSICSIQTQAFMPSDTSHRYHNKDVYKQSALKIKQHWKYVEYNPNDGQLTRLIAQIKKYGTRAKNKEGHEEKRLDEYIIYYGTRILHTNIYGDVIALYQGGIDDWRDWFYMYLSTNTNYDLIVLSRIDLFGLSMVCGVDLCTNIKYGYQITELLCKLGWLDGLKYIVEKLGINHINNKFQLLTNAAYYFNDNILKYLLLQNHFYNYFDIDVKKNKFNETLWACAVNHFEDITKPGTGWLHCLECLHYAPKLIGIIHGNDNDEGKKHVQFEEEGNDNNNWMTQQLENINLNIQTVELPQYFVNERLYIVSCLKNNKQKIRFILESCYYGLCIHAAQCKPHLIRFWKPDLNDMGGVAKIEYIPCKDNDNWGRLRFDCSRWDTTKLDFNMGNKLWLTAKPDMKMVKLCPTVVDDTQLWKIHQISLINSNNIWMQITNKTGYKLIISWNNLSPNSLNSCMPILSLSNKINEIDPLCRDLFSVCTDHHSTVRYLYYDKYRYITKRKDILNYIGTTLNKHSFWRLSNKERDHNWTKFDCYKSKLKNIAQILFQFQQRYLKSMDTNKQLVKSSKRRLSPPPLPK